MEPDQPLRFGLIPPVVLALPAAPAWERTAGGEELRRIAESADRLGYDFIGCSEHVAIPTAEVAVRGSRFFDPAATLGFFAALTRRIRLLTHVVVLPYHHPLEVAKRFGTVDALSGGRLVLGCGVGSLEPEFDLLGVDFAGRGARYDEALEALRAGLSAREPRFEGRFYRYDGLVLDPCAVQARVPIWLGGRTPRSLRRALRIADGWVPFGLDAAGYGALLAEARTWPEWQERGAPPEIVLPLIVSQDLTRADAAADAEARAAELRAAGASTISVTFRAPSIDACLEQMDAFCSRVAVRF